MRENIGPLIGNVNKQTVLTGKGNNGYKLIYMRYGQRLRLARGEMTQAKLSELSKVNQSLISQLENSETATGSEYTNRLARALGINPDWLADEIGEMRPMVYTTTDPKVIAVARMMEPLPEYGKDAAVEDITKVTQLIKKAAGGNGTEG